MDILLLDFASLNRLVHQREFGIIELHNLPDGQGKLIALVELPHFNFKVISLDQVKIDTVKLLQNLFLDIIEQEIRVKVTIVDLGCSSYVVQESCEEFLERSAIVLKILFAVRYEKLRERVQAVRKANIAEQRICDVFAVVEIADSVERDSNSDFVGFQALKKSLEHLSYNFR